MLRLSPKYRLISLIIIILATLLGIVFLIVWPTINKITELKKDISRIEDEMDVRYQNAYKLKRTINELEIIKTQTAIFKKAAIDKGQELAVITELESLASLYNLDQTLNVAFITEEKTKNTKILDENGEILKITKTEKPKEVLSEYYEFSFLINGSFAKEIEYLMALEKKPYYTVIKQIGWEKRQNNSEQKDTPITLTFRGIIYARPEIKN